MTRTLIPMKSAAAKIFTVVSEPCVDWFHSLLLLAGLLAFTVCCLGLALSCKALTVQRRWQRWHNGKGPLHILSTIGEKSRQRE